MTEPARDPLLMQIHGVVVREWGSEKPMQLALPLRDFFNAWLREQLSRPDIIEALARFGWDQDAVPQWSKQWAAEALAEIARILGAGG